MQENFYTFPSRRQEIKLCEMIVGVSQFRQKSLLAAVKKLKKMRLLEAFDGSNTHTPSRRQEIKLCEMIVGVSQFRQKSLLAAAKKLKKMRLLEAFDGSNTHTPSRRQEIKLCEMIVDVSQFRRVLDIHEESVNANRRPQNLIYL